MPAIDKPENYYNFVHQNKNAPAIEHRLGNFQAFGMGMTWLMKNIGVLHVPQWDDKNINDNVDPSAEQMAAYQSTRTDAASVHLYSDSDSFTLALPFDFIVYGCANRNTAIRSIEAEISGFMSDSKDKWLSEIGVKKLKNTARGYIQGYQLQYGKYWKDSIIPAKRGILKPDGSLLEMGFIQHRDVPIFNSGDWVQAPDSFKVGQHEDISVDFPLDTFLEIYDQLIKTAS